MNRQIIIEVDLKDNASGKSLEGFKRSLVEFDKQAQKTRQRLLSLGRSAYKAEVRLIDKISPQGAKINEMLRRLAATQYKVGIRVTNSVFGQITSITTALQRISGRAWPITLKLRDDLTGKIKSLKGMIDGMLLGFGSMGLMGGAGGIGYGLASGLSAYADFEKMSSKVAAVRGLSKNSPEMLALIEQAKQLGMTTQFTRTEAMQSAYFAALAGYDTQSILKFVPHTLNLASAGDLELGRASDILSDSATAFGIKPGEFYTDKQGRVIEMLEGYTDMLAKIQSISNTDIATAYEGLKYSAPVLAAIGTGKSNEYKMQVAEDALIASGVLADVGIKGSSAGTTLRAVFSRFSGENRNALFGLRAMGVEVQRGGEMLTPGEIIQNLRRRVEEGIPAEHLTEILETFSQEKIHADTKRKLNSFIADTLASGGQIKSAQLMKMASMLAGQEAMSGLLALMTSGESWDKKAAAMDNAHGFAASAAATQLDNLAGSVTYLESAWDSLRQSMWEGQAGSGIRAFVDNLTELMTRANNLFKDGIDIPDLGKIAMDAVDRLKNKFVELDGAGSLLSGGVLIAGLTKIGKMVQKTIGYFRSLKGLQLGQILGGATGGHATTEATQSRIVAAQERQAMVQEKMPELTNYGRILENQLSAMQFGTQFAVQDFYLKQAKQLMSQLPAQVIANQQKGWDLLRDMFGFDSTAHAATPTGESLNGSKLRQLTSSNLSLTKPYTSILTLILSRLRILSRSGQNDRYGAPGGVYEAFWRNGQAQNFKEVLLWDISVAPALTLTAKSFRNGKLPLKTFSREPRVILSGAINSFAHENFSLARVVQTLVLKRCSLCIGQVLSLGTS